MFKKGFSYAEAMVTMLIVAIIMVATTPILSKKMHARKSQIWNWVNNSSSIFFGTSPQQRVVLGLNNADGESARLIIKQADDSRPAPDNATLPPIVRFLDADNDEIGRIITDGSSLGIGANVLNRARTAGGENTAIGANACRNITDGRGNICIGANSGPTQNPADLDQINRLYIDNRETLTPLISGTFDGDTTNPAVIINGNMTINGTLMVDDGVNPEVNVTEDLRDLFALHPSDARLKNIKGKSTIGLKEINKLEIKNFTFKKDKEKTPHVGVIAQELIKIFPNSVKKGEDGYYRIKQEEMFYAMINAIKELDKKFNKNNEKTTKLEEEITKLKTENEILTQKIAEIEKKLQEK